jgi:hypothetical protein
VPYQDAVDGLQKAVTDYAKKDGVRILKEMEAASVLLRQWISHLCQKERTGIADELILGSDGLIREAAGFLSLGLVRPTLLSMRAQIDLVLSWLFFKDHPMEWKRVQTTGEGFKLKSDLIEYLKQIHNPNFGARWTVLSQTRTRKNEEPYRLLSAHIHCQVSATLPNVEKLTDLVGPREICDESIVIQKECAEYLGDVLSAVFLGSWAALPASIVADLKARVKSPQQLKVLFP